MRLALLLAITAASACTCVEPPPPLVFVEGCAPLLTDAASKAVDCGLPYPDDFFLADDANTPSGKRIVFRGPAKMTTAQIPVASADVMETFAADGFSRHTPIVWSFGVRADPESVPGIFDDAAATLTAGFATALIEAGTGRRIPHFIDVDPRALEDAREALVMRPLATLAERTRYVVAISGVQTPAGDSIAAPEAFRRLRDANVGEDKVLAPLLARYESDVFPLAVGAGLARTSLQLAWDFTTGSEENATTDLLQARAVALAELEVTPPVVEIDAVFEGAELELVLGNVTNTWRLVKGSLIGPRIVDDDDPGALLARDDEGRVRLDGTTRFPFTAIVPASVRDSFAPAPLLLFGHGFFGAQDEMTGSAARAIADESGVVIIAIDWQGMTEFDLGVVVSAVGGEVSRSLLFGERVMQSMINWLTLTHAMKLGLFDLEPGLRRPTDPNEVGVVADPSNPSGDNAGDAILDVARPIGFLGISQGHILGGTLSALDANIERSILMVGGSTFTAMMFRARPFTRFLSLLDLSLPDPLDQQKITAHMQSQFDRFDPATFAPFVQQRDLPFGPDNGRVNRQVLLMMGVGDSQVPNLGSELHARALGLAQLTPSAVGPVLGLATAAYPATSGFVAYDLGTDPSFYLTAEPAEIETPVHEGVRRLPEAKEHMAGFLNDGVITDACGGACVFAAP